MQTSSATCGECGNKNQPAIRGSVCAETGAVPFLSDRRFARLQPEALSAHTELRFTESTDLQDMYETPRQQENGAMATALDSLKRVFEPQDGMLASLRGLGLDLINGSGVMKKQIMRYAMGVT